jgi:hypothetical protein
LNGGFVNFVFRVTPATADSSSSFVAKLFRPFLSSCPSVPVSCDRYFIEKQSLKDFPRDRKGEETAATATPVRVPRLIDCDDENYILLIEDCGAEIQSLFDYLMSVQSEPLAEVRERLSAIVFSLKAFVATLGALSSSDSFLPSHYSSKGTAAMIDSHVYGQYRQRVSGEPSLEQYADLVEEGRRLFSLSSSLDLTAHDQGTCALPAHLQLSFGDLWPNAIFIVPAPTPGLSVVVLDWEFARIGHRLNDFFQLLAYLALMTYDAHCNQEHALFLQREVTELIRAEEARGVEVTEENLSVLLVNVALALDEPRWEFRLPRDLICREISALVQSFLTPTSHAPS